ncbi:MAG: DUF3413 domain-containing protein, partial [Arsenophonus sp. NEOnobi-MAG3]
MPKSTAWCSRRSLKWLNDVAKNSKKISRKFLERYGYLDKMEYQRKIQQEGNPSALSIEYPLKPLSYKK